MTAERQEIRFDSVRLVRTMLVVALFIPVCAWIGLGHFGPLARLPMFRDVLMVRTGAWILFFLLWAALPWLGRRRFQREPALAFDLQGFTDRTQGWGSHGFVAWEDVTDVQLVEVERQPTLVVSLHDPQAHLRRFGPAARWLKKANAAASGGAVTITDNWLPLRLHELAELMQTWRERARTEQADRPASSGVSKWQDPRVASSSD